MSSVVSSSMAAISSSFSQPEFESLPSSSTMLPSDDAPMLRCFLPIPENPVGSELQTLKNPILDHVNKGPVSLDLTLSSASGSKKRPRNAENPQKKRRARVGNTMTELQLGLDQWNIKKTLEPSDLHGGLCRLLVASEDVQNHILPYLDAGSAEELINGYNMAVVMRDMDTETEVEMVLRRWISSGSYVLKKNWVKGFVKRRTLKLGDQIGLEWDKGNSRFNFSVLKRAATA